VSADAWLLLLGAIGSEVIATAALKAVDGLNRPAPLALVILGYGVSFYLLSLSLQRIPLGVAYAVWSGVGTAAIVGIGWLVYGEGLDAARLAGIALIVIGVVVLNAFAPAKG
jgi:small multidrug resistance pump